MKTKVGDYVRVCHDGGLRAQTAWDGVKVWTVKARMSGPLRVTGMSDPHVRVGNQWCRAWVRLKS